MSAAVCENLDHSGKCLWWANHPIHSPLDPTSIG